MQVTVRRISMCRTTQRTRAVLSLIPVVHRLGFAKDKTNRAFVHSVETNFCCVQDDGVAEVRYVERKSSTAWWNECSIWLLVLLGALLDCGKEDGAEMVERVWQQ
uniref:Uncharacterized protein n=1 Tax=Ascaris lumbricoides TaxID=6252 RepID=A0A0M3HR21_ASCLU